MPGNGTVHSSSSSASSSTGALYMSANNILGSPRGSLGDNTGNIEYSPQHLPQTLANSCANSLENQVISIYYSTSAISCVSPLMESPTLVYSKSVISSANQYQQSSASNAPQPQTPQTPTSIPDIILTGISHFFSLHFASNYFNDWRLSCNTTTISWNRLKMWPFYSLTTYSI